MVTMTLFRKSRRQEAPSSTPITGATFGPWATHNPRCTCNVCR